MTDDTTAGTTPPRRVKGPGYCLECLVPLPRTGSSYYATHCRAHSTHGAMFRPGDPRAVAAGRAGGERTREAFEALRILRERGELPGR